MSANGHIYISYARADGRGYAERLFAELRARGIPAWRDRRTINPHLDFSAGLEKAIDQALAVVVCVTPSIKRDDPFVRRELGYALGLRKPIIPLMFAEVLPPISIVNFARVDFLRQTWGTAVGQLIEWLQRPAAAYGQPLHPPDPFRSYLQMLYTRVVGYLDKTVFFEIPIHLQATPDAIHAAPRVSFFGTDLTAGADAAQASLRFEHFAQAVDAYDGRVLLLGEPEAGKTVILMAYARDAVAQRLEDPSEPLPVLGRIADWPVDEAPALADWLGHVAGPLLRGAIAREASAGRVLFLLDGLEEAGSKRSAWQPDKGCDPHRKFLHTIPYNNRVMITCRARDYQQIGEKLSLTGAVTLLPLDDTQLMTYLHSYPELFAAAQADPELRELMQMPLFLSLFTQAYKASSKLVGNGWALCRTVLEMYAERRYQQEQSKPDIDFLPFATIHTVLARIAERDALEDTGNQITLETILEAYTDSAEQSRLRVLRKLRDFPIARKAITMLRERLKVEKPDVDSFVEQALRLHLLVPSDDGVFRFMHLLLRDYFAVDLLLEDMRHAEPRIRMAAAHALGNIRDIRAVEPLITALADGEPGVRMTAAQALGDIGDTRAVEPLLAVLHDVEPRVRLAAAQALGDIEAGRR